MSCLLPLVAGLCLADPANITISADASKQVTGKYDYWIESRNYGGAHVGRVAIQMETPLTRTFSFRLGWEHLSLLDTDSDRGQERIFFGVSFRPFGYWGP